MKKLLLALIAAGFASATVGALAADEKPYTGQPKIEKPGRAADDGSSTVKSGGDTMKPGRAADDSTTPPASGKKKKSKKKKGDDQAPPKQ
jgi:hypothetical protein